MPALAPNRCDACTALSQPTRRSHAPLQQFQVEAPMERVGVDIVGLFPTTDQWNHYVLVAMDYFTTAEHLVLPLWCT